MNALHEGASLRRREDDRGGRAGREDVSTPGASDHRRLAVWPLLTAVLLAHCALFAPARPPPEEYRAAPCVTSGQAVRAGASAPTAGPAAPSPPPVMTEVAASRGFHLRRSMVVGLAPVRVGERDGVFEVLHRLLARRSVRVLDLSRASELRARVEGPAREQETTLEGPWLAASWAARWGGASHLLVSDEVSAAQRPNTSEFVATARVRLLALPGAEAVWAARVERRGDSEAAALARVFDALVDALHGTLRDEPEVAASAETPTPPRASRRHRRRPRR